MLRAILCACVLCAATSAQAQHDERLERCTTLSFEPLEVNVPACTALLENTAGLDHDTLADIYAARAEAYEFAITYHAGREIEPENLLNLALADLDEAVRLSARHHARRADVLFQLSRFAEAAQGYTAAMEAPDAPTAELLRRRSMARAAAGQRAEAIEDMSAAIAATSRSRERVSLLLERARLHEADGEPDAAVADYRSVLQIEPSHTTALEAMRRLRDE